MFAENLPREFGGKILAHRRLVLNRSTTIEKDELAPSLRQCGDETR